MSKYQHWMILYVVTEDFPLLQRVSTLKIQRETKTWQQKISTYISWTDGTATGVSSAVWVPSSTTPVLGDKDRTCKYQLKVIACINALRTVPVHDQCCLSNDGFLFIQSCNVVCFKWCLQWKILHLVLTLNFCFILTVQWFTVPL